MNNELKNLTQGNKFHNFVAGVCAKISILKSQISNSSPSFTLIEVMVAMVLITMIVLMVSNMFLNSSEAWDIGTRKAELTTSGRAVIEFIAREISQAVAGPVDAPAAGIPNLIFRQENESEIRFVALSQEPGGGDRALRDVVFYFNDDPDYKIMACMNRSLDYYNSQPSAWNHNGANPLLDNVLDIQFFVYETMADLKAGDPENVLPHDFSKLPVCVDVFIEILSRDDMKTAASLPEPAKSDFIDKNAKAYSTRVYFPNRMGYGGGD